MFAEIRTWTDMDTAARQKLLCRPALADSRAVTEQVAEIIAAVRQDGDSALRAYAARFEGCTLESLRVSEAEFRAARAALTAGSKSAIDLAIDNVRRFHATQVPADIDVAIGDGIRCERRSHPLDAVGLYVPAGTAPLPSTAIMLAVPASIAACPVRVLCTPAGRDGNINAATLYAAWRSGVRDIFKIGGAQAIAAMAYGTPSVPRVNRIFGPGNTWVTTAKTIVAADPAGASIDMPAGPSEVLVIADAAANPAFVAADLLSQAEHGTDSQVILVTTSRDLAVATIRETEQQLGFLARERIARASLQNSHIIVADSIATAIDISNRYAPEHLILQIGEPRAALDTIRNAGSVFLGHYTPESVGDYCSGTNHVLPTYGMARSYSGLGVEQFMRHMTVQELTADGLRSLAPAVIELAELEGLGAHAEAVRLRLAGEPAMRVAR